MKGLVCAILLTSVVKASVPQGQQQPPYPPGYYVVLVPQSSESQQQSGDEAVQLTAEQVQAMTLGDLNQQAQKKPAGRGHVQFVAGPSLGQSSASSTQYGPTVPPGSSIAGPQFGRRRSEILGRSPLLQSPLRPVAGRGRRHSSNFGSSTSTTSSTIPSVYSHSYHGSPSSNHPPPAPSTNIRAAKYNPTGPHDQSAFQFAYATQQDPKFDSIRSSTYDSSSASRGVPGLSVLTSGITTSSSQRVGSPPREGSSRPGATFIRTTSTPPKCPYGHGSVPSGPVYVKSPFSLDPPKPLTSTHEYVTCPFSQQSVVVGKSVPLSQQMGMGSQAYSLGQGSVDYKLRGPFSAPASGAPTTATTNVPPHPKTMLKEIDFDKWIRVHYKPGILQLGQKQFSGASSRQFVAEIYDPHWTGQQFRCLCDNTAAFDSRPSRRENYPKPDHTDRIDTYNPKSGYGRGVVDAGSRNFSFHAVNPSRTAARNPIIYVRFSLLKTEKIVDEKYLLVLTHFDARDWQTVSSVLNNKRLAVIPRHETRRISDSIRRRIDGYDERVLIRESKDDRVKTVGDRYAYLNPTRDRAEEHAAHNCMMLFES